MKAIDRAYLVAEKAHSSQSYDIYPYIYHLKEVHNIALELGYDIDIQIGCVLHDALEDSDLSYNDIKKAFGYEVAEIVYCVTDELGRNRKERKEKTLPKIKSNWKATVVKICDRIANMKHSKDYNKNMFDMYIKEHKFFVESLRDDTNNDHPSIKYAWDMLDDYLL